MILRVSAKFQRQYRCEVATEDLPAQPFFHTWNLDLISNGSGQLIVMASEEHTLFTVLVPMTRTRSLEQFENQLRQRLSRLAENLRFWGLPIAASFTFCRRTDRRMIGSQGDFIWQTQCHLMEYPRPASTQALLAIEERVNESPMSYLGMESPIRMLMAARRKIAAAG